RYLAAESAGQCGPCAHGLDAIAELTEDLNRGVAAPGAVEQLRTWMELVNGRGACRHPDGAVRFLWSALYVFADDFTRDEQRAHCTKDHGCGWLPLPSSRTSAEVWR